LFGFASFIIFFAESVFKTHEYFFYLFASRQGFFVSDDSDCIGGEQSSVVLVVNSVDTLLLSNVLLDFLIIMSISFKLLLFARAAASAGEFWSVSFCSTSCATSNLPQCYDQFMYLFDVHL
jgi:hypothetical protein